MRSFVVMVMVLCSACRADVEATARFARGASASSAMRTATLRAPATAGHWFLSPNASTVTITTLRFGGEDEATVDLTGCTPSYERDAPRLSTILDCPFQVPTGTYSSLSIGVAGEASVTVDDPVNGLFTDPSAPGKLTTTLPAGGAQPVTVTVPTAGEGRNEIQTQFLEPLEVTEGQPVTITILVDMIHTMSANVSGSDASFDLSLPLPPVFMLATAGDVASGSVEYYAPTGTADNYTNPLLGTGNETGSARVFFVDGKPTFVWHVIPSNSEAWAADPHDGGHGGYLGLDGAGTLCWAHTDSDSSSWPDGHYTEICRLQRATNLGDVASLDCQQTKDAPRPTSGKTYESGCPTLTVTDSLPVTLVAR